MYPKYFWVTVSQILKRLTEVKLLTSTAVITDQDDEAPAPQKMINR